MPDQSCLKNKVCFSLYALSRKMTALYRPYLDALHLTYPQYLVLLLLWQHKQLSVNQLGEKLLLDSGTLTPLLKRMEETGLVVRERCKQDERRLFITLTKNGESLQKKAAGIPDNIFPDGCINSKELEQLTTKAAGMLSKIKKFEADVQGGTL